MKKYKEVAGDDRTGSDINGGPNINTTPAEMAEAEKQAAAMKGSKVKTKAKFFTPDQQSMAKKMNVKLPSKVKLIRKA